MMRQVVQSLDHGVVRVVEVPLPRVSPHQVLVRVEASLISAGTERSKVELGQSSLLEKARHRPQDVKKVLDRVRREGLLDTYKMVQGRLEAASPLGYSCAGVVERVGELVQGLQVGDRVACAGAGYANHAEYVSVPQNLCAKMPERVDFTTAAFTTLGAIAMQGFRQSGAVLGDRVAIIGLGLLGQLTLQIARAAGCDVVGIDLADDKLDLARRYGAWFVARADDPGAASGVMAHTDGHGVDAILITAAASTNAPIVLAGEIARDRAPVVVVGDVRIDVPRSPFYEKELVVKLSRSYGPGRYDPMYEEYGVDYPDGYVRWTERSNMSEFLRLASIGKIDTSILTTHRFDVGNAPAAYDLVTGKVREPFIGVVLEYPHDTPPQIQVPKRESKRVADSVGVSVIGAGNFVTSMLLPALQNSESVVLRGIMTSTGLTAGDIADKRGFAFASGSVEEIMEDSSTNVVLIGTRHDTHAELVSNALRHGKHAYVEKPLAVTRDELQTVIESYAASDKNVMVGFNRRYAPHTQSALKRLAPIPGPRTIVIRVNAGAIPPDHWTQQLESGGGRIVGEMCHFIDLAAHLAGAEIVSVHAAGAANGKSAALQDSLCATMTFANGSIASVTYCADGDTSAGKELVEVMAGGAYLRIDDFRVLQINENGKSKTDRLPSVDKGHKNEMQALVQLAKGEGDNVEGFAAAVRSTLATFAVVESLSTGLPVRLDAVSLGDDE